MEQRGFFSLSEHLEKLSEHGNPLENVIGETNLLFLARPRPGVYRAVEADP